MKNKNLFSKLICISFVLTTLFTTSTSYAATQTNDNELKANQQGAYSQAYTDSEWAKAKNKPVVQDKTASKSSINRLTSRSLVGSYPTRFGVILVTADAYKGLIPTGHSAIIWDTGKVIEAVSSGVVIGPNDWNNTKGTCYGVTVNTTTEAQDNAAANWCRTKVGLPYNYNYLNPYTRSKFYCSQLVYASFLDNYSVNLNTNSYLQAVHPMELVNTPNTNTIYQK